MSTIIRSVHNERIKRAARLRTGRGRRQQRRIIVDGYREVTRALQAGVRPTDVFICETAQNAPRMREVLALLTDRGIEPALVTSAVFAKVAFGDRSEGVVLVAPEPQMQLSQIACSENALVCVLEGLEKPGNLGAILRTADAVGLDAVIVADGCTDPYNHNAIRASLGAIFGVPVCTGTAAAVRAWLEQQQFAIYAARVDAAVHYACVDYRGRSAIVLGSEADGLSASWAGAGVTAIALPMHGIVDSLNVASTAAVLCYEALRQRDR